MDCKLKGLQTKSALRLEVMRVWTVACYGKHDEDEHLTRTNHVQPGRHLDLHQTLRRRAATQTSWVRHGPARRKTQGTREREANHVKITYQGFDEHHVTVVTQIQTTNDHTFVQIHGVSCRGTLILNLPTFDQLSQEAGRGWSRLY